MPSVGEILSAGRLIARRRAPYLGSILLSFECRVLEGLGTVGCTERGILVYDPDFVGRRTADEMGGLWVHECLHRLNLHGRRRGARDAKLWNIACDLAINDAVVEMGCTLPTGDDGGLFPKMFGFEPGLTADDYYERLRQQQPPQQQGEGPGQGSEGDEEGGGDGGEGQGGDKPHAAGGWCGSCAGRPVPGEPPPGEGRSDGELARLNRAVAEAVREHQAQKGRGSVPAGLARWAEEILTPVPLPWWRRVERLVRGAVAWRAGAVDHRWDGPGRRQAGLGHGAGRPVLPRLRQPVPRVACAVDTSGSMGGAELASALRQVNSVLRACGAEVDFVSCDATVHGLGRIRRVEDAAALCRGGGGTDFRPVFKALAARRPRPEIVVFATDGMGPAPEECPRGMTVVWLLIGGTVPPCAWGEVVVVDGPGPEVAPMTGSGRGAVLYHEFGVDVRHPPKRRAKPWYQERSACARARALALSLGFDDWSGTRDWVYLVALAARGRTKAAGTMLRRAAVILRDSGGEGEAMRALDAARRLSPTGSVPLEFFRGLVDPAQPKPPREELAQLRRARVAQRRGERAREALRRLTEWERRLTRAEKRVSHWAAKVRRYRRDGVLPEE